MILTAKEICSLHNRQLPAIKEIRAKLNLGLRESKQLVDEVWDTVEHPKSVDYNGFDRVQSKMKIVSLHVKDSNLLIYRSDGENISIKLNKKVAKETENFLTNTVL